MSTLDNADKIDILLVDDRDENLLSLEAVLACPEYNLIKTRSGEEALRYLLEHTPSLILMDVQMPKLNGFETASIIQDSARTREIPIIFVTAINKDRQFIYQGYDHGAVDYIYKPYDPFVLRAKVSVFAGLGRRHSRITQLATVQRGSAQALGEFNDVDAAIGSILKIICTTLKWELGIFWQVNQQTKLLHASSEWHNSVCNAPFFIAESSKIQFAFGVDVPGRVWESKEAFYLTVLEKDRILPRLTMAMKENLRTVIAFPVLVQDEVMGVFEFYSKNILSDDPEFMKIMTAVGSQVGQVMRRTKALELLRISEARSAAMLGTDLDCVFSMDHEGKIIEFNPAEGRTFGHRRSDMIGKELAEVILSAAFRETHRNRLKHCLSSGADPFVDIRMEVIGIRSDKTEFPAELAITRVSGIVPPLFTGFLRDLTGRKRIENNSAFLMEASATLSSSLDYEETFSIIVNLAVKKFADWCSIDVMDVLSRSRPIAFAHSELSKYELLGKLKLNYPLEWNLLREAPSAICTEKSMLYSEVSDKFLMKIAKNQEHLKLMRDLNIKSIMTVDITSGKDTLGRITFVSAKSVHLFTKDDLIVAEELARRAAYAIHNAKLYRDLHEVIRSRDEFLSVASHELKTPITALKMMVQMIQRNVNFGDRLIPLSPYFNKMLTDSVKQVDRLTHLVEELLDVVKIRAGKFELNLKEVTLSELVRDCVEQYTDALTSAQCQLELNIENTVIGEFDHVRIEQIVANLISNVIKYAPGSPIKIEVSKKEEIAKIIVQDFGPGIPLGQQKKVFYPFERGGASRNISGLGLGLFIVKQAVEAHCGTIFVNSQEGHGSTFTIELPIARKG